jgi:hypothetical protein
MEIIQKIVSVLIKKLQHYPAIFGFLFSPGVVFTTLSFLSNLRANLVKRLTVLSLPLANEWDKNGLDSMYPVAVIEW